MKDNNVRCWDNWISYGNFNFAAQFLSLINEEDHVNVANRSTSLTVMQITIGRNGDFCL